MAETRIGFLYKAAAMLAAANKTQELLKSYYKMRCKKISKGYGLPQKYFSEQIICTHCCLEWRKGTEVKVKSIKLSKRQRKRIKAQSKTNNNVNKTNLFHSNEIEQTCPFCGHTSKTVAMKPHKPIITKSPLPPKELHDLPQKVKENVNKNNKDSFNVYSNTVQVFSLNNKKNTLKRTTNEPKIIKNNKKKKDKFAGLCQKAVLMSAHLKEEKAKLNKLSLFLKPSS